MKSRKYILLLLVMTTFIITACSSPDMRGIILDMNEDSILLSQDLTQEEYDEIDDLSAEVLQNEDVLGERGSLSLMYLSYDLDVNFEIGDEVDIWLDGPVMASYPGQGVADLIRKVE